MLDRPAAVIALMRDGGDDAGLAVGPGNPADAGLFAQARAAAIGGHEQRRRHGLAARQSFTSDASHRHAKARRPPRVAGSTPAWRQASTSAPVRSPALTIWAKGSPPSDLAVEGEKAGRTGSLKAAVGDHHVEDRLRLVRDPVPDPQRLQHPARRRRDSEGALVPVGSRCRAGSHITTSRPSPSACLSASARESPARPPPAMTTRQDAAFFEGSAPMISSRSPRSLSAIGSHPLLSRAL